MLILIGFWNFGPSPKVESRGFQRFVHRKHGKHPETLTAIGSLVDLEMANMGVQHATGATNCLLITFKPWRMRGQAFSSNPLSCHFAVALHHLYYPFFVYSIILNAKPLRGEAACFYMFTSGSFPSESLFHSSWTASIRLSQNQPISNSGCLRWQTTNDIMEIRQDC